MPRSYQGTPTGPADLGGRTRDPATNGRKWWSEPPRPPLILTLTEVVLEATYGWYWAADVLAAGGAHAHLAHPLGVKAFEYRRVKNDVRDASDLADLLRMGRLPQAWIAPPATERKDASPMFTGVVDVISRRRPHPMPLTVDHWTICGTVCPPRASVFVAVVEFLRPVETRPWRQ
jgi:hypothetical protein